MTEEHLPVGSSGDNSRLPAHPNAYAHQQVGQFRAGTTLALDFPNKGEATLRLLSELDNVVLAAGGAVYPAKDARMPAGVFAASFPKLSEFRAFVDPRFSSGLWRRVGGYA